MDEKAAVGVVVGAEIVKALLMLAFEEARRRNLTAEAAEQLYLETRLAFLRNDPANIPEV
jgi:hypothetical protein